MNLLLRIQIVFRHNKTIAQDYHDILGESTVKMLQITSEKTNSQYGISLIPRINDQIRAELKDAAIAAMQANRDGGEGITFPEYMLVMSMVDQNQNPKSIMAAIAMFISRRQKKIAEQQQKAIAAQGEQNKQLQAESAQQATRAAVLASFLAIKEIDAKANADIRVKGAEGEMAVSQAMAEPLLAEAMAIMGLSPQQPPQP